MREGGVESRSTGFSVAMENERDDVGRNGSRTSGAKRDKDNTFSLLS